MTKKDTKPKESTVVVTEAPHEKVITSASGIITIPGVKTATLKTLVIGTSLLVCHKFSEKAKNMILAKHMGEASSGRELKVPKDNYNAARYRLSDGTDGIPAGGVKACIVKGFSKETGVAMTKGKGAIRVLADDPTTNNVRIICPHEPTMREDVVRNESGVVDIRHRPEYWPWALFLKIDYLPEVASQKRVLQAIAMAGFREGLCEWRPGAPSSLSGTWGAFRMATVKEVEQYEDGELFADFEAMKQAAE